MTETKKIRKTNVKTVIIKPDAGDICFGCMNKECRARGGITAENPLSLSLKAGQRASIYRQALAALVPPAIGFTAGFFLTRFFLPEAGDGACAAAGVIFLFISAFAVYTIKKGTPPKP